MKKKLFGILLSAFMLITLLPATVFAETISTIGGVLATAEGSFPTDSSGLPWVSGTDLISYVAESSEGGLGLYFKSKSRKTNHNLRTDSNVVADGNNYKYVNGGIDYTITFNMTDGKLTGIVLSGTASEVSSYFGTYTPKAETVTIADILPSGFPTSESNAWKTKTGKKMYIVDGSPNTLLYGSYGIQVTNELTKSGSDYTITTNNGDTLTFKMNDDVLKKVVVEGTDATKDGNAGTYTLSSKKVSFVMADSEKTTVIKDIVDGEVDEPVAPTITDYDFKGWYYCDDTSIGDGHYIGMVKLDSDNVVDEDITVYAAYLLNCIYNGESGNIDFIKTNFASPKSWERYSYDDGKTYKDNKSMPNEPGTYSVWMQGRNLGTTKTEYFIKVGDAIITVNYEITDGNQATINTDENKDVLFTSAADYSKFVRVDVDNVTVDPSKYSAVSGSTKITMKASYLNTLAEGNHTLTIVSNDGKASTTFTITKGSKPSPTPTPKPGYVAPKTGIN